MSKSLSDIRVKCEIREDPRGFFGKVRLLLLLNVLYMEGTESFVCLRVFRAAREQDNTIFL